MIGWVLRKKAHTFKHMPHWVYRSAFQLTYIIQFSSFMIWIPIYKKPYVNDFSHLMFLIFRVDSLFSILALDTKTTCCLLNIFLDSTHLLTQQGYFRIAVGEFHSEALQVPHLCRFNHENSRSSCNDYQHWKNEAARICKTKVQFY